MMAGGLRVPLLKIEDECMFCRGISDDDWMGARETLRGVLRPLVTGIGGWYDAIVFKKSCFDLF